MTVLGAVGTGILAAAVVSFARFFRVVFPHVHWFAPMLSIIPVLGALALYRLSRGYEGLTDILHHVHSPKNGDSPPRWNSRGLVSFLFWLVGGPVGSEGAAIEVSHAALIGRRSRADRWSEQVRRTDAAVVVAASVSAAFGAPFAAFVLVIEMGFGGRALAAATASVAGFMTSKILAAPLHLDTFDIAGALYGFKFQTWRDWLGAFAVVVVCAPLGVAILRARNWMARGFEDVTARNDGMRVALAGVLLIALAWFVVGAHEPSPVLLEQSLWARRPVGLVALGALTQLFGLLLVSAGIGTAGIFWPLLAVGGLSGYVVHAAAPAFFGSSGAAAGMVGASAIWGAVLGAPLAGGLIAYELTQNFYLLLPCLAAALIGNRLRRQSSTSTWAEDGLKRRGLQLAGGRIAGVIDSIPVSDAMVCDHETVDEKDTVADLHARLLRGRYPFLPVIDAHGRYQGMLTVDTIEDAWLSEDPMASNSPLARLLEAKDLLYRSGKKLPAVQAGDTLAAVIRHLEKQSCLPVVDAGGKVVGLLFVHNVRLAYDREVARRALVRSS